MKTKLLIIGFAITALLQLAIPGQLVWENEMAYTEGTEYKFKTEPIDPNDPLRGKYIRLDFEADSANVKDSQWNAEYGYAVLGKDHEGFAKIDTLLEEKPKKGDHVKVRINSNYGSSVTVDYPFNRFYMEESKAPEAERLYAEYLSGNKKLPAYAVVSVRGEVAVVKDVIIDGIPVKEYVEKHQKTPYKK